MIPWAFFFFGLDAGLSFDPDGVIVGGGLSLPSWRNKKTGETRTRTYVLPAPMRAAGIVVNAIISVTADIYDHSDPTKPDTTPQALINGSAVANAAPLAIKGQVIGASQAVLVSLKGGVTGCTYVVTFTLLLSTGETFIADCLQYISKYLPTP